MGVFSQISQVANIAGQSEFGSNGLVLLEVVDVLAGQQIHVVDVFLLANELKLVALRLQFLVFAPAVLLLKGLLQVLVPQNHEYPSFDFSFLLVNLYIALAEVGL